MTIEQIEGQPGAAFNEMLEPGFSNEMPPTEWGTEVEIPSGVRAVRVGQQCCCSDIHYEWARDDDDVDTDAAIARHGWRIPRPVTRGLHPLAVAFLEAKAADPFGPRIKEARGDWWRAGCPIDAPSAASDDPATLTLQDFCDLAAAAQRAGVPTPPTCPETARWALLLVERMSEEVMGLRAAASEDAPGGWTTVTEDPKTRPPQDSRVAWVAPDGASGVANTAQSDQFDPGERWCHIVLPPLEQDAPASEELPEISDEPPPLDIPRAPSSPMVSEHAIRAALAGGVSQAEWPKVVQDVAQLARERRMGLQWEQGARARLSDAEADVERLSDEVESLRGPARQWGYLLHGLATEDEDAHPGAGAVAQALRSLAHMTPQELKADGYSAVVAAANAARDDRHSPPAPSGAAPPTESPDGAATQQDGGGA